MACTLCYFFMPQKAGSKDEILAAWLQEFAWTSSSLPAAIAERNRKLEDSVSLRNEPMFCMETAIKLLYFSIIVYGCEETKEAEADRAAGRLPSRNKVGGGEGGSQGDPPVKAGAGSKESSPATEATLGASELGAGLEESDPQLGLGDMQVALGLYDLDDWEVVWEKETDTKALLAWGESTVVVAFKGTSSRENIITDMNVSYTSFYHEQDCQVKNWATTFFDTELQFRPPRFFFSFDHDHVCHHHHHHHKYC